MKNNLIILGSLLLLLSACATKTAQTPQDPNKIVKLALEFPLDDSSTENDSVLQALESVVSLNKTDTMSWGLLAKAYYEKAHYTKAIRASNEAINLNPNNTEAKKIALLSSIKLAENKFKTLQSSKQFNKDMQEEVQVEIAKLTTALTF